MLRGPETGLARLAFTADGRRLFAGTGRGALHLWQTSSGQPLAAPRLWGDAPSGPDPVHVYAFAPAARRLATLRDDGSAQLVEVWDPDRRRCQNAASGSVSLR